MLLDDVVEETSQLHPTEPLEKDDLVDLVDLPPLELLPPDFTLTRREKRR